MSSVAQSVETLTEAILRREDFGNSLADVVGGGHGSGPEKGVLATGLQGQLLASRPCLEKNCSFSINGNGDPVSRGAYENGVEDGCGVSYSGNGSRCERAVHENGTVDVQQGRLPASEVACLPSMTSNMDNIDGGEGNCIMGISENDTEPSVIGRKVMEGGCGVRGYCCDNKASENQSCCSLQLDGCEKNAACMEQLVIDSQGKSLVLWPCLETCSSPINTSEVAIDDPIPSENGVEPSAVGRARTAERCEVSGCCSWESNNEDKFCTSPKLDGFENVSCHNKVVLRSTDEQPSSEITSEAACLPSLNNNRCAFDARSGIHSGLVSDYCDELSSISRNGLCCYERDLMNNLCGSPQSDACRNVVCKNEVALGSQGHSPALQSCLAISYPSKNSTGVGDMGDRNRFQPVVGSESGMKLSASGWDRREDDCGVRRFCSNGHNMEDWFSSPRRDDFNKVMVENNSQSQLQASLSCLETGFPSTNHNEDTVDGSDHFNVSVASISVVEPSITGSNLLEDKHEFHGLCSAESNMEDQSCSLLKYSKSKNLLHEKGSEPLTVGKNEVGDGCRASGTCSDIINTEYQSCSSLHCNGYESITCKNDVYEPKGPFPSSWICSGIACTVRNISHDALNCPDGLCSNESNMENYLHTSGIRRELGLEVVGSRNDRSLGNPSYDEDMPLVSLPNTWDMQNEHQEKLHVLDSLGEIPKDQKRTEETELLSASNVSTSLPSQKTCINESPSILTEGPPDAASYCAVEESASPRPSQLANDMNLSSSKHLARETDEMGGSCSFDSSRQAVDNGKVEVKLNCISRNTHAHKSSRLTRTRKAARQAADNAGVFLNKARRKRSSCRQTRLPTWGAMGNVIQLFRKNCADVFNSELAQDMNRALTKGQCGLGGKRRRKAQIKASKAKHCASTSHARSKVKKKGKSSKKSLQAVFPDVVETPAAVLARGSDCFPPSDSLASFEVLGTSTEVEHRMGGDVSAVGQSPCLVWNSEKRDIPLDVSVRDALVGDKELESTVSQDASIENTSADCPRIYSLVRTGTSGEALGNRQLDPEMSPVLNVSLALQDVCTSATEGIISTQRKAYTYARRRVRNDSFSVSAAPKPVDVSVSSPSQSVIALGDITPSNMKHTGKMKGKRISKRDTLQAVEFSTIEEKLHSPVRLNKAKKMAKHRLAQSSGNSFLDPSNTSNLATTGNYSSKTSDIEVLTANSLELSGEVLKAETGFETRALSGQDVGTSLSGSWMLKGLSTVGKVKGRKLSERSKAEVSKLRSEGAGSIGPQRGANHRAHKGAGKNKVKDVDHSAQVVHKEGSHTLATAIGPGEANIVQTSVLWDLGRTDTANKIACEDVSSSIMLSVGNDPELSKPCYGSEPQLLRQRLAWVRCDDCHKWRWIPAELADEIEETDRRWTCKDNKDKKFSNCRIPQEKSNAEINAELDISDASCEEDSCSVQPRSKGLEPRQLTASQQNSWTLIKSNLFLQRSRRTQTIDEVMVCHCKPPLDGKLGCGDECLNRMLNIECVQGTCPCGDFCSNQQFQKRKYAKLKWFRCGKKGYGLQLEEDVSRGSFLIEYVGEVLDLHAYEARQREYALRGQKHFYFMTLNGSEVIDACFKGNLGRFINHSCDPNCRTEKWMVNGEVCIGLFAIRDLKMGEEVTFDYNYVRVFGAAAKKCVCGSSGCRGYIGGDPSNTEAIVQVDSDDEYPEPVMVHEESEAEHSREDISPYTSLLDAASLQHDGVLGTTDIIRKSSNSNLELESSQLQLSVIESSHTAQRSEVSLQTKDVSNSVPSVSQVGISLQMKYCTGKPLPATQQFDGPYEAEDTGRKSSSSFQLLEGTYENANAMSKSTADFVEDNGMSVSDTVEAKRNSISDTVEDKSIAAKSHPIVKSSRQSGSIKKGKYSTFHGMANKGKKLVEGAGSGRFEGVEEKLNELLDADGGISKRKDAAKVYLKLLFVTAASGDHVNGEAFQSTRDLSIVLDAILKTKSRTVLLDIVNKNGLQMLHNIMKQNRKNFNKIPIIRKLLKVLEFLALKEILTIEHINMGPPCEGMESFKDSIITLTKHNDTQVQQISRGFRDKWIPRTIRRINFTERDDGKIESQSGYYKRFSLSHRRWHDQGMRHSDAIDCVGEEPLEPILPDADRLGTCLFPAQSSIVIPSANSNPVDATKKTRKRKSRWDQPAEVNLDQQPLHLIEDGVSNLKVRSCPRQTQIYEVLPNQPSETWREMNCSDDSEMEHITDDAPPGFSLPLKNTIVAPNGALTAPTSNCSPRVQISNCDSEVISGHNQQRFLADLPVSYGIALSFVQQLGRPKEEAISGWAIAPGLPFHPFPPLPKYPRGTKPPVQPSASTHKRVTHEIGDEAQQASICNMDPKIHAAVGVVGLQEAVATGESHKQTAEGWPLSDDLGRRNFRQQRFNNRGNWKGPPPPWVRLRNGWGFKCNGNMRNGATTMGSVGYGTRDAGGLCYTECVNCSNDIEKINSTINQQQQQYHH